MQEKAQIAKIIHDAFCGEQHYIGTELRNNMIIVYVDSVYFHDEVAPVLKKQFGIHTICARRNKSK